MLNTNSEFIESTLSRLRSSDRVRHVVPQRRFYDSLKQTDYDIPQDDLILNMTGRAHTPFSVEDEPLLSYRKLHSSIQVPELFNAHFLWEKGYTGISSVAALAYSTQVPAFESQCSILGLGNIILTLKMW
jgi:hypothetical protein